MLEMFWYTVYMDEYMFEIGDLIVSKGSSQEVQDGNAWDYSCIWDEESTCWKEPIQDAVYMVIGKKMHHSGSGRKEVYTILHKEGIYSIYGKGYKKYSNKYYNECK